MCCTEICRLIVTRFLLVFQKDIFFFLSKICCEILERLCHKSREERFIPSCHDPLSNSSLILFSKLCQNYHYVPGPLFLSQETGDEKKTSGYLTILGSPSYRSLLQYFFISTGWISDQVSSRWISLQANCHRWCHMRRSPIEPSPNYQTYWVTTGLWDGDKRSWERQLLQVFYQIFLLKRHFLAGLRNLVVIQQFQ